MYAAMGHHHWSTSSSESQKDSSRPPHPRSQTRSASRQRKNNQKQRAFQDSSRQRNINNGNRVEGEAEESCRMSSNEGMFASTTGRSNLDCFLDHTTPTVQCQYLSKSSLRSASSDRWRLAHAESMPFFSLGDLWESFHEWSAYGAGVPIALPCGETVVQYYVPYLSALQIYGRPGCNLSAEHRRRLGDDSDFSDGDLRDTSSEASSDNEIDKVLRLHPCVSRERQVSRNEEGSLAWDAFSEESDRSSASSEGSRRRQHEHGHLLFEYFERCSPYGRAPLVDKIAELARGFPKLSSLLSIELSSASWISVAWYPIYRIPTGPTLRDLATCFLTFHSLSMPLQAELNGTGPLIPLQDQASEINPLGELQSDQGNEVANGACHTYKGNDLTDEGNELNREAECKPPWPCNIGTESPIPMPCRIDSEKIALPAFGLASYKLRGALWASAGNLERRRVSSLASSADSWLKQLHVQHPDFDFFVSHGAFTRR